MGCRFFLLLMLLFLIAFNEGNAQTFQIRSVNKENGVIALEMRNTSATPPSTSNYVTDIVFGIKWQSSYNVDLASAITTSYSIIKSDVRKLKNNYHFQAFSAANTPYNIPASWTTNNWVEIMSIANTRNSLGTSTFAICETGFDVTTDLNFGLDLTDHTPVINDSATGVILPIILSQFQVSPQNNSIKLNWSTATEINNRGFEIQRSAKEPNRFDSIGWVAGKGNSTFVSDYTYIDKDVVGGIVYYYRLKQVDYDSKMSYSAIKSAKIEEIENKAFSISPNPASSVLRVFSSTNINGKIKLRIIDAKGSALNEMYTTLIEGQKVDINVSAFPAGSYYLVIQQEGEIIFQKQFQKG